MQGRKTKGKDEYLNKHNVQFTKQEIKNLERLVNRANTKRDKMLEAESQLPYFISGEDVGQQGRMGKESDFILAPKSADIERFKNKAGYETYINNLERVLSPSYIDKRIDQYRDNFIKMLESMYGEDDEEMQALARKIKRMSRKTYMQTVQSNPEFEFKYHYDPVEKAQKRKNTLDAMAREVERKK